jgi:8-oxo-dGTP pyrophosphatase MutT (NUDIX family)
MNAQRCDALVVDLLRYRKGASDVQCAQADRIVEFVRSCEAPWRRSTPQGHLTASAWIVDHADQQALLLHHKKLDKWLQPGGHVEEEDESFLLAALREAREETGLTRFDHVSKDGVAIFDVDVHPIPARPNEPAHFHYDIRYQFVTRDLVATLNTSESHELKWFSLRDVASDTTLDESVRRMATLCK